MKSSSPLLFVFRLFLNLLVLSGVGIVAAGACIFIYNWRAATMKAEDNPLPILKTGGTSSAATLLENSWKSKYRKTRNVQISYESTGSTEGVKQMIDKKISVCFSHAPLTAEQRKTAQDAGGSVVQIPVVAFAVVPIYNVKELKNEPPLKLDAEVLAGIFLGRIAKWNAEPIVKLNPELKDKLPERDITVIHRKDSSGTTLVFSEYLYHTSQTWRSAIDKPSSKMNWTCSLPAKRNIGVDRNIGVANAVLPTVDADHNPIDAIGYVDLLYAQPKQYPYQYAAVLNKDGKDFIHAEPKYLEAAMQQVLPAIPENLEFNLANKSGPDSYPISGVIWASCYQNQPAADVQKVKDFLTWILHEGQSSASFMSNAPLPPALIDRADALVQQIKAKP